jgi:hypothetical protein
MTEVEWLTNQNLSQLLPKHFEASGRKFRLMAVATCRCYWNNFTDWRCKQAVEIAERYAEGEVTDDELGIARARIVLGRRLSYAALAYRVTEAVDYHAATESLSVVAAIELKSTRLNPRHHEHWFESDAPSPVLAPLLRDIFGNPFRPVAFDPAWRSSTALAIATGIYDERAFDRLPILADAIQDTGCENEELLNHLRSDGPHVKGCWALDLVLGKE